MKRQYKRLIEGDKGIASTTITVEQKNQGKGHKYIVHNHPDFIDEDGNLKKMDSVTGICGAVNGTATPILTRWAVKQAIESLTWPEEEPIITDEKLDRAKKAPDVVLKNAGDRGTRIHNAIEKYLNGAEDDDWQSELDSSVDNINNLHICFEKIQQWIWFNGFEVKGTELPVYQRELEVGGAVDMVLGGRPQPNIDEAKDGSILVCDFKTGNNVYWKDALQVSGYISCLITMMEDGVCLWDGFEDNYDLEETSQIAIGGVIFHIDEQKEAVRVKHVTAESTKGGTLFTAARMIQQGEKNLNMYEQVL